MRALFSLRSSGTLDYKNAVGKIATVYVTVPPNHNGGGQVEVLIQVRLQTISCMTAHYGMTWRTTENAMALRQYYRRNIGYRST
jgi:NADH:ubiquinone oxidoreductase subunit D